MDFQEIQSEIWSDQQFMNNISTDIFEDIQEMHDNNNSKLKPDTNSSKPYFEKAMKSFYIKMY